jgi:hypothetical protein
MEAGGQPPTGQWGGGGVVRNNNCTTATFKFSDLGRKLMLIDNWD